MKSKKPIAVSLGVVLVAAFGTYVASGQIMSGQSIGSTIDSPAYAAEGNTKLNQISDTSDKMTLLQNAGFTEDDLRDNYKLQASASIDSVTDSETTKEYIYDRMLNTVDYFTYLSGSYEHYNKALNDNYTVDYNVKMDDTPKAYEKLTPKNGPSVRENYFDGKQMKNYLVDTAKLNSLDSNSATKSLSSYNYNIKEAKSTDFLSLVKATSRYKVGNDGAPTFYYRADTTMTSYAREVIFPQERTLGCLRDFTTWDIVSHEQIIGRDCVVIKGSLSGDYSNKLNTNNFTFWVDSQTGVLLQLEGYNANGELTEYIKTKEFNVDSSIEDSTFTKMVSANIPSMDK